MKEIFSEIKIAIKSSLVILIIGVVVFLLGVVLGLTISLPSDVSDIFAYGFINYFANVYNVDFSPFSALFSNVFSLLLVIFIVCLLSLNKFTIYLNFLILFYHAYLLGLTLKIFILTASVLGVILFLFLIFIKSIFILLAILLTMILFYSNKCINKNTFYKIFLLSACVAVLGAIIEFLFIVTLFRPLCFCF